MKNLFKIIIEFESSLRLPSHANEGLRSALSISSDRLFSFICLGWARLYSQESLGDKLIKPFLEGGKPFLISDLLPLVENEIYIPASMLLKESSSLMNQIQEPWAKLSTVLSDKDSVIAASTRILEMSYLFKGSTSHSKQAGFSSLIDRSSPNFAATHRNSSQVAKEGEERLCFASFLSCRDQRLIDSLEKSLQVMKDDGLGGMRSSGKGKIKKIELEECSNTLTQNPGADSYLLLSHCCPEKSMLSDLESSPQGSNRYKIGKSAGWIYSAEGQHSGIKKPRTIYFETGSVFSVEPRGRLIDLSEAGLPCFRYGIPFTVRVSE